MLRCLIFISMLTLGFVSYGQTNMEEVVYLKDGSSLRGTILEQIPNETLKIQTKDGSIFVCKFSDVLKITKEKVFKSLYYANLNTDNERLLKQYKASGIGLTTTAGVCIVIGSACFAGGRNRSDYYSPGGFIAGITFLCASTPFLISGPIMLSRYRNLKREIKSQKELSFAPSIRSHNLDGISSNASSALLTYGVSLKFNF